MFILTDDQRWDTLWAMPNVEADLVADGVTFEDAFVVNSLCCPSYDPLVAGPATDQHLVANIDLAPTRAHAAGVPAPGADGASLFPLLTGVARAVSWRTEFLIEHIPDGGRGRVHPVILRGSGEEELYDLAADPWELQNVAGGPGYATVLARHGD